MSRPYGRRPPYRSRDRLGVACTFWLCMLGVITGTAVYFSIPGNTETPGQQYNICYALRTGTRVIDIENALLASGYTESDAGALTGRMLRDHCPDQIDNVTRQLA